MNASEVSNQLSLYLGLGRRQSSQLSIDVNDGLTCDVCICFIGDETIKENVLPHLESMTSRAELQDYLTVREEDVQDDAQLQHVV